MMIRINNVNKFRILINNAMILKRVFILLVLFQVIIFFPVSSQSKSPESVAEIAQALEKLQVLGSVLYIAAHPDDENTRLITYYANEEKYRTAYLSLTRGDGGQNLIGPQLRESLGIIRTHELLAARKIDGGQQFFTRANDFGYSKNPDETFNIWDREKILADMVWVIRKFKPDVIITRFNTSPGTTHGHHTASSILAKEAFNLAADKNAFPDQLEFVKTWQPKRIFWNTSSWFYRDREFDKSGLLTVDVGKYNHLLGKSYTEIAANSRSQHRSQGFGAATRRGSSIEYLKQWDGSKAEKDIMSDIATDWSRLENGSQIGPEINNIQADFNIHKPYESIPKLLQVRRNIAQIENDFWREIKLQEIDQLIAACSGLFLEAAADQYAVSAGDSLSIDLEIINRSPIKIQVKNVSIPKVNYQKDINKLLSDNKEFQISIEVLIPEAMPLSQPYWLRDKGTEGTFKVDEQQLIGLPENPPAMNAQFLISVEDHEILFAKPVVFKDTDPARGEIFRPLQVVPKVYTRFDQDVYIFTENQSRDINVMVRGASEGINGKISVPAPEGWQVTPAEAEFSLSKKEEEIIVPFTVTPPAKPTSNKLTIVAEVDGEKYDYSAIDIVFDHIPAQTWFPESSASFIKMDLQKKGNLIGYIKGAGDAIPKSLLQVGYQVEFLQENDFNQGTLAKYDAIITGIRAFNVNDKLPFYREKLMKYVKNGGTLIAQYNTSYGLSTDAIGPYPMQLSRERVTEQQAPVKILAPDHPVMNTPNKITEQDFNKWVQERGLYFAGEWDKNLVPILSSNDPGEPGREGGLLVGQYGEGYFVYTGYSWFRQLPAGVPGAYRIFTNLISLGK